MATASQQQSSILEVRNNNPNHQQQQQHGRRRRLQQDDKGHSNNKTKTPFLRFHDLDLNKLKRATRTLGNLVTSYDDATVLEQASFFPFEQICKSTCCATAVAISLDPEEANGEKQQHLIHTVLGMELADTSIAHYPNAKQFHTRPPFFTEDLVECLQPGTIIQMDNHATVLNYFWKKLRPKIKVPFVMITSESDGDTPDDVYSHFAHKLKPGEDPLLLKWYGTNPNFKLTDRHGITARNKFVGMPLGLSRQHKQAPFLNYYLQKNQYRNPFNDKERWISAFSADDKNDKWLLVNFNIHGYAKHRQVVHDKLCHGVQTTATRKNYISCSNQTESIMGAEVLYAKSSEYLFGASPPGMGWDCYRTYELLLLGVIPIIDERSGSRQLFKGLPVLFVNQFNSPTSDWTRDSLYQQAKNYVLSDFFRTTDFTPGWNRLFTRYWQNRLLQDAGRSEQIYTDPNTGQQFYKAWKYTRRNNENSKKNPVYCHTLFECQSKSYIDQTPAPTIAASGDNNNNTTRQ